MKIKVISLAAVMALLLTGCGDHVDDGAVVIPFTMPIDGKVTVVIDDAGTGQRVRNLLNGIAYSKGRHTIEWDGRAEDGTGASGGRYRVRVITHAGLSYDYRGPFAAGGERMFSGFGPNHLPCEMVVPAGERIVFASLFTEGGNSTLVLDHDGRLVNGYGDGWNLGNKACFYLPSDGTWLYSVREADGNRLEFHGYGVERNERRACALEGDRPTALKGATRIGSRVYLANGATETVDVYELIEEDWRTRLVFTGETIPCALPGPLAVSDGGLVTPFKEGLIAQAVRLGRLYTLERGSSQIHIYDLKTHAPLGTMGEEGGSYTGLWRRDRLVDPRALAFDSAGSLWVAEFRYNPKRLTRWNVETGTCDYEKIGSEKYGSPGGGMDRADPTRWIAHDTEWRYDPDAGIDYPIAQLFDEKADQGELFDLPPRQARTYKFVHRDGKTFVIGNDGATMIWEYLDDEHRLKPLMMQGTSGFYSHMIDRRNTCVPMRDAYRRAFPEQDAERFRYDEETLMIWRDQDGDERFDADEFSFAPYNSCGTGGWGLFASDLDFTCAIAIDGEYNLIDFTYPDYSMEAALAGRRPLKGRSPAGMTPSARTEGFSAHDGHYILPCLTPYMLGFASDGTLAWYMKNPHPGVHGSHDAPLPRPGELQGVLFALGSVPAGHDGACEVAAYKNNHGRIFFITTDGIYLDEMFSDCRVAAANDETYIGGESFGGSFEYDDIRGRAVLVSGGGGYRWYDINGLDTLAESGFELTVTDDEIVRAQERHPLVAAGKARPVSLVIPDGGDLARVASWRSGDWRIELSARREAGRLRFGFHVEEPSPWVNNGTDPFEMFKTGDCVDFQYLDETGEPCRLMVYPPDRAVLYRHNASSGSPHVFASPWRQHKVGDVSFPDDLAIRVRKGTRDYTVEFDVPGEFTGDRELKADFGVIFGDRDGRINQSRVYWSNKETGLVNDVPGEIMPEVGKWGTVVLGAGADAETVRTVVPASARLVPGGFRVNPHGTCAAPDGENYHRRDLYAAGPVYDRKRKLIYASAGQATVRALTLDGEEKARYTLPDARAFDRFDSMAFDEKSGDVYVLAGGLAAQDKRRNEPRAGILYRITPDRSEAVPIATNLCAISQHLSKGRLAVMTQDSTLDWLDVRTLERSVLSSDPVENGSVYPCMIDFLADGTPIAFVQHNWYYLYRDGRRSEKRTVFGDREISMTRGAVLGDDLWLLAGATIKRYSAVTMKSAPGVVYGGASGYFIGHVEMDEGMNAVGICALDEPNLFAVLTAFNSAVHIMRYDPSQWRLKTERRLGGVSAPANLAIDDDGMIVADSLCWRWDDGDNAPSDLTLTRMPVRATVALDGGRLLHITETHGSRIEFRHGRLMDGELTLDWQRDSKPYPEGVKADEGQRWNAHPPVSAFARDGTVYALSADGVLRTYRVDGEGHPIENYFAEYTLPHPPWRVGEFKALAPLADGDFVALVGRKAFRYRFADGAWSAGEAIAALDGDFIAADGGILALADAEAGEIRLFVDDGDGGIRLISSADGLAEPSRIAIRNDRLAVWEKAAQRIDIYRIAWD